MTPSTTAMLAQQLYRCLVRATACPGERVPLPSAEVDARMLLASLLDGETSFTVLGSDAAAISCHLEAETGARAVRHAEAEFALVTGGDACGDLTRLPLGTPEHPERGATVLYQLRQDDTRETGVMTLSGPGVPGRRRLSLRGASPSDLAALRRTGGAYPLGLDVYFVGDGAVVGLPRSTTLEVAG